MIVVEIGEENLLPFPSWKVEKEYGHNFDSVDGFRWVGYREEFSFGSMVGDRSILTKIVDVIRNLYVFKQGANKMMGKMVVFICYVHEWRIPVGIWELGMGQIGACEIQYHITRERESTEEWLFCGISWSWIFLEARWDLYGGKMRKRIGNVLMDDDVWTGRVICWGNWVNICIKFEDIMTKGNSFIYFLNNQLSNL